ncbi:MAG: chemotaxis protein CheB [Chitinophagaceae bacterium]|nr:chemotaxis protein CheB [Chitinophagaceae bacterium]
MEKDDLKTGYEIIVIGGSAGSLEVILPMLERVTTLRFPIVVVLHRKSATDSLLIEVLSQRSAMNVKEVEEKEPVRKGIVYLAPPDYHLLVENDRTFSLDYSEKINFSRPSIDVTFESVASVYGEAAVAILLSGGNADGVEGLKTIKAAGGMCVVQDPGTAEIAFMPAYAVNNATIDLVVAGGDFAGFINSLR